MIADWIDSANGTFEILTFVPNVIVAIYKC